MWILNLKDEGDITCYYSNSSLQIVINQNITNQIQYPGILIEKFESYSL